MVNANIKHNPLTLPWTQNPIMYPHANSLLLEISSQEQLSPEQMSDHPHNNPYTHIAIHNLLSMM